MRQSGVECEFQIEIFAKVSSNFIADSFTIKFPQNYLITNLRISCEFQIEIFAKVSSNFIADSLTIKFPQNSL